MRFLMLGSLASAVLISCSPAAEPSRALKPYTADPLSGRATAQAALAEDEIVAPVAALDGNHSSTRPIRNRVRGEADSGALGASERSVPDGPASADSANLRGASNNDHAQ